MGKGFLTGKINDTTTFDSSDLRGRIRRFEPEARRANQVLVDLKDGATPKVAPAGVKG